jgi:hypothetical protein
VNDDTPKWLSWTSARFWFFTAALLVGLPCGVIHHGDGHARYLESKSIVLMRRFDIPAAWVRSSPESKLVRKTPDGRFYPVHNIGMPLLWTPAVAVASLIARDNGPRLDAVAGFLISLYNPFIVWMTALSLVFLTRRFGYAPSTAGVVSVYLSCTLALVYANTAFSEPVCGIFLLWALTVASWSSRRTLMLTAGLLVGLLPLIRYELALAIPIVVLLPSLRKRWDLVAAGFVGSLCGPALVVVQNILERGSPFLSRPGPLARQLGLPWDGLIGYGIDPDKALFLYYPILLLAVTAMPWALRRTESRTFAAGVLALWLVLIPLYASSVFDGNPNWGGGLCYGTRHFVLLMPVTALVLAPFLQHLFTVTPRVSRRAIGLLCALGALIQLPGISVKSEQAEIIAKATGQAIVVTQAKLLWLKLRRGPAHPEVYRSTDFVRLSAGTEDTRFDFTDRSTFQWLHHWWAIILSNRLQGRRLL